MFFIALLPLLPFLPFLLCFLVFEGVFTASRAFLFSISDEDDDEPRL